MMNMTRMLWYLLRDEVLHDGGASAGCILMNKNVSEDVDINDEVVVVEPS